MRINHNRGWEEGFIPARANKTPGIHGPAALFRVRPLEGADLHLAQELQCKNASGAYLLALTLVVVWTAGALIAPIGIARGWVSPDRFPALSSSGQWLPDLLGVIVHAAYGRVCHQMPERSLWIQGHPMAVCARCFGIYLGCLVGLLVYPFARKRLQIGLPRQRWLIFALLPLAIDFLGGYLGVFQNTAVSRTATGLIAGIAGAIYTAPGLITATGAALAAVSAWRHSLPLSERGGAHNA